MIVRMLMIIRMIWYDMRGIFGGRPRAVHKVPTLNGWGLAYAIHTGLGLNCFVVVYGCS